MTPDWPRNGKNAMKHLGCFELMDDPQWEIGYAGLAEVDFSFDMQVTAMIITIMATIMMAMVHAAG